MEEEKERRVFLWNVINKRIREVSMRWNEEYKYFCIHSLLGFLFGLPYKNHSQNRHTPSFSPAQLGEYSQTGEKGGA